MRKLPRPGLLRSPTLKSLPSSGVNNHEPLASGTQCNKTNGNRQKRAPSLVESASLGGGGIVLLLVVALHVGAWMIGRNEQPERLALPLHVTARNRLRLLWAEKHAINAAFTIVFIHGTPGRAGVWREQFARPFPNANLIAYDRPGFGASMPVMRHPHLDQQVEALTNLLAVAAITNRVLLVGHSYGGPIALLAAIKHPDRISGVLLVGADVSPKLEKMLWIQYAANSRVLEWLVPRSLRECNREILAAPHDLLEIQTGLSNLTAPVVMLHGTRDTLVQVENVAWLESRLAALGKTNLFAKIVLPGANHFIPWERPEEVAKGIEKLVRLTGPRAPEPKSRLSSNSEGPEHP